MVSDNWISRLLLISGYFVQFYFFMWKAFSCLINEVSMYHICMYVIRLDGHLFYTHYTFKKYWNDKIYTIFYYYLALWFINKF